MPTALLKKMVEVVLRPQRYLLEVLHQQVILHNSMMELIGQLVQQLYLILNSGMDMQEHKQLILFLVDLLIQIQTHQGYLKYTMGVLGQQP